MSKRLAQSTTCFFLCDIQKVFRSKIVGFESLLAASERMVQAAKILEISVIATEQVPNKLGATCESLLEHNNVEVYAKTTFSMLTPEINMALKKEKVKSVVIFGLETHVCVQQSVLDLLANGYEVHVLHDAVSSRKLSERSISLNKLRDNGAVITTTESVLFELLADANHPKFRDVSKLIRDLLPDIDSYPDNKPELIVNNNVTI